MNRLLVHPFLPGEARRAGWHVCVVVWVLFLAWFSLSVSIAQAAPKTYWLTGKVIRVSDGDTFTLRNDSNQTIRLASIDAPEKKSGPQRPAQPYSEPSREFLANLVAGKILTLTCYETDRYGRHICDVPIESPGQTSSTTANRLLVQAGLAWANQQAGGKYLRDQSLLELEQQARQAKRGLWVEPHPVAPWVWRKACWQKGQCGS